MENLVQRLNQVKDRSDARHLFLALEGIYNRLSSVCLSSAGLVIKAPGSALVKAANIIYATANGTLVTKIANTDMAALSGTVTNAAYNVYVFTVDSAGTLYTQMGTEGATLAKVRWPTLDQKRAIIGFVIIHPTGTGDFVGGTTPIDDATKVPNAVYVNTQGAFDPTALTGV